MMNERTGIKESDAPPGPEPGTGMSQGHALDLKLPIGWLLSAYGLLLAIYGLLTRKELYEKSFGINVNLIWGLLMLAIGGIFLLTTFLKKRNGPGTARPRS
jgi:hypothetical protein